VLDTHSGAVLRSLPLAGRPVAVAVEAATGRVLLQEATEAGVRALDPRTGRLARIGVGADPGTHLLLADGPRVVLARWGRGTLTLLNLSRRGRCVVPVGGDVVVLGTDERVRRTVVLSGADLVEAGGPDWVAWAHGLLRWPPRLPSLWSRRQFVAGVVSDLDTCA
jgi:hypothetical protein